MLDTIHDFDLSPPCVTSTLRTQGDEEILIVRDDYLTGGTKERALWGYLGGLTSTDYVYASPFSGFAQIALAHVSAQMGRTCTIIAEIDPRTGDYHPYSLRARSFGANLFPSRNLAEAEEIADRLVLARKQMIKIPLGFNVPEFRESMARVLTNEWTTISKKIPGGVRRLWIPVGSGTLATSFLSFLSPEIEILGLNVRVLDQSDKRLVKLEPEIDLRLANRPFHEPATVLPGIPSNLFYDAKLWEHINEEGRTGDVWWNVAG